MYRNAVYSSRERCVKLFTWSDDGKRVVRSIPFSPYLYIEDPKGEKQSIFNTAVKKRSFNNAYERRKFVEDSRLKRFFENTPPVQQFLIDNYWEVNETKDFIKNDIKVTFIDIETFDPLKYNSDHKVKIRKKVYK